MTKATDAKEAVSNLKRIAEIADEADGRKDGNIQRSSIDTLTKNPTSEIRDMMWNSTTRSALEDLLTPMVLSGRKTFKVPTDEQINSVVAEVSKPKPPAQPCEETTLFGLVSAPSWLADGLKTKVCPKR